jgi:Na+/H+-dicarboxylate symporter
LGVLALAACSVGEYGTEMFSALGMFILTHYVGAVSQIYGVDLTLGQQAMFIFLTTLISIGTPGIPASGIVLAIMLLNTMGLPTAIMGMIVGIFRPIDMIHTALNVTGDVVSTLAVARMENMYEDDTAGTDTELIAEPAFNHEK